jgi:hypothetical protein
LFWNCCISKTVWEYNKVKMIQFRDSRGITQMASRSEISVFLIWDYFHFIINGAKIFVIRSASKCNERPAACSFH